MKKHSSFCLAAAACLAACALAACDLRSDDCVDEAVGARFIVTPSPGDRVPAVVSVNGDDAGDAGVVDGGRPVDVPARPDGGSDDAPSDASPTPDAAPDAGDAAPAPRDGGSVYGDDLSCAQICRLGFGPGVDVTACRGPYTGTTRLSDGDGGLTATEVVYADCEAVTTVCRGNDDRGHYGRQHHHHHDDD